jgi:hypothetical protein
MNAFSFMEEIKATPSPARLDVLPVSVLEVAAGGAQAIRETQDHNKTSSRATYSAFPFEAAELCASLYFRDAQTVVDPFAGWGERHEACLRHGKTYHGFDLSSEAVSFAKQTYGVTNILADSREVNVPEHDALLTCPPYWDLEEYESDQGLDKCASWELFLEEYEEILHRFSEKAKRGAVYSIATGDWRSSKVYYDLTHQTESIMEALGFVPHDKVVISRLGISKVKIMLPQAKAQKYTVKVHESLNTWIKR